MTNSLRDNVLLSRRRRDSLRSIRRSYDVSANYFRVLTCLALSYCLGNEVRNSRDNEGLLYYNLFLPFLVKLSGGK